MFTSLNFLMSIPGAAIEEANINEDGRVYSIIKIVKEHSTALSIVSRINVVIKFTFAGSMIKWTNEEPMLLVCYIPYRLRILIKQISSMNLSKAFNFLVRP